MQKKGRSRWASGALILSCMLVFGHCAGSDQWRIPHVVQMEGIESCINFHHMHIGWFPTAGDGRPVGVLARDGDILFGEEFAFPYRETDGESLELDSGGDVLFFNGKLVSLQLSDEGKGWNWLRGASLEDLTDLRFLGFEEDAKDLDWPLLRKVAQARPDIWLSSPDIDQADVARLVSLFEPHGLAIEAAILAERFEELKPRLAKLEWLMLAEDGNYQGTLDFLSQLPQLHTLSLLFEGVGTIPSGCRNLRSVSIFEDKGVKDLFFLRNVTGLRELVLQGFDELEDISALAAFPELRRLAFLGGKNVRALSVLEQLPRLAWLGFPQNTTQEAFAQVLAGHPGLEVVELVACDNICDLSPLRNLRHLQAAIVLTKEVDFGVLQDLKGLRYLALHKDAFQGEKVAALEKALPDTFIARFGTFCLGSGWILLLAPAILLLRGLFSGHEACR